jgi:two-component system response regulator HydG
LVVDDAPDTLEVLQRNLSEAGHQVFTASSVVEAIELLDKRSVDLVITDLKMPKISGLDLVRYVRENMDDTEVMMITGYATVEGAVDAVKMGAEEYLPKPFTDDELFGAIDRVLEKLFTRRAARLKPESISTPMHGIIAKSPSMQNVFHAITKAATTPATVLISGESGTGKELVARAIHYMSSRARAPFVPINCGAIPGELVESELFGHVKGAFTGATDARAGFFQTASGGTIFLDEIGEMTPATQVKLLRVLENKEVYMVGSSRPTKVDARIITATNKNLRSLVKKGTFRDDLYFRISVITITIPPLRERGDDVFLLTKHFAAKFADEAGKPVPEFSDRALEVMKNYDWPGNVRELDNLVQRLIVMKEGVSIGVRDLPSHMRFSVNRRAGLNRSLADMEADYINNVLASVKGNKTRAADILGIDRKTLREKIKHIDNSRIDDRNDNNNA